jgi:transposase
MRQICDGFPLCGLLVCEMAQPEPLPVSGSAVGVDVGISSFTILSNGEELENPRHLSAILEGD